MHKQKKNARMRERIGSLSIKPPPLQIHLERGLGDEAALTKWLVFGKFTVFNIYYSDLVVLTLLLSA